MTGIHKVALLLCLIFLFQNAYVWGQDCQGVSARKDKTKNSRIFSGISSSDEFFSLLISK